MSIVRPVGPQLPRTARAVANEMLLENPRLEKYRGRLHEFQFVNLTDASFSWHLQANDLGKLRGALSKGRNSEELARLIRVWAG